MAKCKKGTIWDSDSGECRVPTKSEKLEINSWQENGRPLIHFESRNARN